MATSGGRGTRAGGGTGGTRAGGRAAGGGAPGGANGSATPGARQLDKLIELIPRLQTPIHLIAFLAVVAVLILWFVRGLEIGALILVLGGLFALVVFVHAPGLLQDAATSVKIVFLVGCFLTFILTMGFGVYLTVRQGTGGNGTASQTPATWESPPEATLAQLIDPVAYNDKISFAYKAEGLDADTAESEIRKLRLCTSGKIHERSFYAVFNELARRSKPCLRAAVDEAHASITLILDTGAGGFVARDGCDVCRAK